MNLHSEIKQVREKVLRTATYKFSVQTHFIPFIFCPYFNGAHTSNVRAVDLVSAAQTEGLDAGHHGDGSRAV